VRRFTERRNRTEDCQKSGPKAVGPAPAAIAPPASGSEDARALLAPGRDTAVTSEIAGASKRARGALSISFPTEGHVPTRRHAVASSDSFCLKTLQLARYDLR
jgi:hypothetical protein